MWTLLFALCTADAAEVPLLPELEPPTLERRPSLTRPRAREPFTYQGDAWILHTPGMGSLWPMDLALTGVGIAGYYLLDPLQPIFAVGETPTPQAPDDLGPYWDPTLGTWSDFLGDPTSFSVDHGVVNFPVIGAVGAIVTGGIAGRDPRSAIANGLIYTETLAAGFTAFSLVKLIGRPRPYTRTAFRQDFPDAWASAEIQDGLGPEDNYFAYKSFLSGHTTNAGTASFGLATILFLNTKGSPRATTIFYVAYSSAAAITLGTGALRVFSGYHYITDVAAGAVLGASIGVGVPWLHQKLEPQGGPVTIQLAPMKNGLAVSGTF